MNRYRVFLFILTATLWACDKVPQLGPATDESLATASEDSCGFVQNSYGQRVSWKGQTPVSLQIHPSVPTEFDPAILEAASTWEDAAGQKLFHIQRVYNTPTSQEPQKDAGNFIYALLEWDQSLSSQQAVTNIYWRQSQINEADIKINLKNYDYALSDQSSPHQIHLKSLLVHELGHFLGLKHQTTVPSVMWTVLLTGVNRSALTEADKASLRCGYSL